MTTLSEDIDYLAIETKSESNDGRASAATWEHEDLAQVSDWALHRDLSHLGVF